MGTARIGELPALAQTLLLKEGDTLILKRSNEIGRPALYDQEGLLLAPGELGISLPGVLEHAKPGEPIWFDDGKIGGTRHGRMGKSWARKRASTFQRHELTFQR